MTPELTYGTTLIRCAYPAIEWIDTTPLGAKRPVYLEKWRGWQIELWEDWDAIEWGFA